MPPMKKNVSGAVKKIFSLIQEDKSVDKRYLNQLRRIYIHTHQRKLDSFVGNFLECLADCLNGNNNTNIAKVCDIAEKFSVSLQGINSNTGGNKKPVRKTSEFITAIFEFLTNLLRQKIKNQFARYRMCHFINTLLKKMDTNIITKECYYKTASCMVHCLIDNHHQVRVEAIVAVVQLVKMNERCRETILEKACDENENIRRGVYIVIKKIPMITWSNIQKQELLKFGMNDHSIAVRNIVQKQVLSLWLQQCGGNVFSLLCALDIRTATEIPVQALISLFKQTNKGELFQQLPLNVDTKSIPMDELTAENALYWRCYVDYINEECNMELLKNCLPDFPELCDYIYNFEIMMTAKEYSSAVTSSHQFILCQLFELTKICNIFDVIHVSHMTQLIRDTILKGICSKGILNAAKSFLLYLERRDSMGRADPWTIEILSKITKQCKPEGIMFDLKV